MTDLAKKLDPRQLILEALDDPDSGLQDLFFVVRLSNPPQVEYLSKGMERLSAVSSEALTASMERIWNSVHPDDRPMVQEAMAKPAGRTSVTYRYRTVDGAWRWIEHRFTTRTDVGPDPFVIGVGRDVTDQKSEEAERQSRATALEATAEMVLIAGTDGTIEYVNSAFEKETGYSRAEAVGQHTRMLQSGRQPREFYKDLWDTVLQGDVWVGELVNRRKDGSEYVEEMTITPVKSRDGRIARFVAIKRDISTRKAAEEELTRLAMTDPLTGLANRRQFEILFEQAVREAIRRKSQGAIAYLDLDGFKEINDTFGHAAGDEALRQVGNTLRNSLRRSDIVARMGGDEFAVLLHDATPGAALTKLKQLVGLVSANGFAHDGKSAPLRCSAGVVGFPEVSDSPDRILELADVALYQAKQAGGNAAHLYDGSADSTGAESG